MYTLEEIKALQQKCETLELEGVEVLKRFNHSELQVHCNGIGPANFPDGVRKIFSAMHPSLEPAAFIHDAEWSGTECSREHFSAANERFRRNGITCAKAAYKWYNPLRYLVMNQARRFANYCDCFGFRFYSGGKVCTE